MPDATTPLNLLRACEDALFRQHRAGGLHAGAQRAARLVHEAREALEDEARAQRAEALGAALEAHVAQG